MRHVFQRQAKAPQHAVGIDISDGSIELVNLGKRRDNSFTIQDQARVVLDPETIVHGTIVNEKKFIAACTELFLKARLDTKGVAVASALPDGQVLTKAIPLAAGAHQLDPEYMDNLAKSLYKGLGYHIPTPRLQWTLHRHSPERSELIVYVADSRTIQRWQAVFRHFHMKLIVMEMESLALARALLHPLSGHDTVALLDFGYRQTNVCLFDAKGLRYSHTIGEGGLGLTSRLAHELNIAFDKAEQRKRSCNLAKPTDTTELTIVHQHYVRILEETHEALQRVAHPITRAVITGGASTIAGLKTLTEKILGYRTVRGTLSKTALGKHIALGAARDDHWQAIYAGAYGLAIRGASRETLWRGINFVKK
ncbi:MAG: pilus assembly protein PilM [Candidatus Komeilibacteria bacterium]|nr:pilus assembly protein PilM [Candidatus Komeilibacteria bacterium]